MSSLSNYLEYVKPFLERPESEGATIFFKMPWAGRLNIQKDKKMAKQYQVRQVAEALKKLKSMEDE